MRTYKNYKEDIIVENEEIGIDLNEEEADTEIIVEVEKPKKSIKKKLLIAGGVVIGLVLGAIVLGSKKQTIAEERLEESDDEDGEDTETKTEDETK